MLASRPHTKSQIMFIFCSKNLHEPGPLLGSSSITAGGAKKVETLKTKKPTTMSKNQLVFLLCSTKLVFGGLMSLLDIFSFNKSKLFKLF